MAKTVIQNTDSPKDSRVPINNMFTELYTNQHVSDATDKATPVDADLFGIWDSVATTLKKLSWANLKATLKIYFDTLYGTVNGWIAAGETWTYASADGATGVFNVAADVTAKYCKGMRVKYQQALALTAYWTFNTNSNSDVGSFNGTDTAMSYATDGKFGKGATFNGTSSKIVLADNASLKPTGEFTLGMWFKKTGAGTQKTIFQAYSANTNICGIRLQVEATNKLTFVVGNNTGTTAGSNYSVLDGTTNVADNAWHYVVVSFRNNYCQIYLDGVLEVAGYMLAPAYAATTYIRFGCYNPSGSDSLFFDGMIDDPFLINGYALDEQTIKAKYDAVAAQGTGNITVQKYGIITNVGAFAAGNTPITIWGGIDHSTANATISNPFYSSVKVPFGFPSNPSKWTVEFVAGYDFAQSSPAQNTWYNAYSISVPIGDWKISMEGVIGVISTASQTGVRISATLSKANNTESDIRASIYSGISGASGSLVGIQSFSKMRKWLLAAKTTLYFNMRTVSTAASVARLTTVVGSQPVIISAECAYL